MSFNFQQFNRFGFLAFNLIAGCVLLKVSQALQDFDASGKPQLWALSYTDLSVNISKILENDDKLKEFREIFMLLEVDCAKVRDFIEKEFHLPNYEKRNNKSFLGFISDRITSCAKGHTICSPRDTELNDIYISNRQEFFYRYLLNQTSNLTREQSDEVYYAMQAYGAVDLNNLSDVWELPKHCQMPQENGVDYLKRIEDAYLLTDIAALVTMVKEYDFEQQYLKQYHAQIAAHDKKIVLYTAIISSVFGLLSSAPASITTFARSALSGLGVGLVIGMLFIDKSEEYFVRGQ